MVSGGAVLLLTLSGVGVGFTAGGGFTDPDDLGGVLGAADDVQGVFAGVVWTLVIDTGLVVLAVDFATSDFGGGV